MQKRRKAREKMSASPKLTSCAAPPDAPMSSPTQSAGETMDGVS